MNIKTKVTSNLSLLFILFYIVIGQINLPAQEIFSTTGGEAQGYGGSMSYTIGQIVYQNPIETSGSLIQGVQQPYEIIVVTNTNDVLEGNLEVMSYPNPANDYLVFCLDKLEITNLSYSLYDYNGKFLRNARITELQTKIIINDLVPSVYFLKINRDNKVIRTFKIIKK